MLNRKYFPFQRNNYYYGKLLTARDFEDEQRYFNDKRRLANRLTGANGIVAGLGVIRADDASLVIQAGCATDAASPPRRCTRSWTPAARPATTGCGSSTP